MIYRTVRTKNSVQLVADDYKLLENLTDSPTFGFIDAHNASSDFLTA
jgi:hypothetical protein